MRDPCQPLVHLVPLVLFKSRPRVDQSRLDPSTVTHHLVLVGSSELKLSLLSLSANLLLRSTCDDDDSASLLKWMNYCNLDLALQNNSQEQIARIGNIA